MSGKASVLDRVAPQGNVYVAYGTSVTPPGTANFTLSAQANNQNNPSVEPQESTNIEVGTKWDFAGGPPLAEHRASSAPTTRTSSSPWTPRRFRRSTTRTTRSW